MKLASVMFNQSKITPARAKVVASAVNTEEMVMREALM
jgi:hypothetical protein